MKSSLFKNSSYSVINNFFQLFVSLASGMIIARMLGTDGKGILYLVNQIVAFGAAIFALGIGPSLLFYLRKNTLTRNQALSFCFYYTIIVAIILLILFYFFKEYTLIQLKNNISEQILFISIFLIIINILVNILGYILMNHSTGVASWSYITILGNVVYIIALFILVFLFYKGVIGAIIALLVSLILRLVIVSLYLFSSEIKLERVSTENLKIIFKYGIGVLVGNIFLTAVYRIDVFFVNGILSVSELGIYSAAVSVSELLLIIPSALGIALFPHLTSLDPINQVVVMSKISRLSTILGILGSLALLTIAYPFIILIFGNKFIGAFVPTLFLLPGLLAMTLNYSYSNYFSAIGKPILSAIIFAFGVIINILLNIFFLRRFGINGAAIFSSISYMVITIGFIIIILKTNKNLKLREILLPGKEDYKLIIIKIKNYINQH